MCRKTGDRTLQVGGWHFSIWFSSRAVPMGGGCTQYGSPREAISPGLPCLDFQLRQINSACLLLAITLIKLTHQDLLSWGWTVLPAMVVESVWWGCWVVVTFVMHQTEPVVHCLQVVNNCFLILALLATPRAVGQAIEVVEGLWVMYAHQFHNLWGLWWGHHLEELEAFW